MISVCPHLSFCGSDTKSLAAEPPPSSEATPTVPAAQQALPGQSLQPLANRSGTAAILLPLTGPQAQVGAALLNAAQMALFEVADDSFTLVPIDTKGTPEGAAAAVQTAVSQHAEIILGPLFAAETRAAATVAKPLNLPVVAFTSDRNAVGDGVYTLGFLPGPQAVQVAAYARSTGKSRLAILAPSNEEGQRVAEYLQNDSSTNLYLTSTQYYDPAAADLAPAVKRLVHPDPKTGDVGFDALLLLEGGQKLRNFAAMLSMQGVDPAKVKLLGTMLWADANSGAEPALNGAWFAAPAAAGHADFEARYLKAFGGKPPRIASLGYDATALAAVLARKAPHDFSAPALTNQTGFAGIDGIFRLLPNGTAERGYAVDEVQRGAEPKEIAPAPTSF